MRIHGNTQHLADILKAAFAVAPRSSPKEILRGIKVTAIDKSVRIDATDMEASITLTDSEIEVRKQGAAVLLPRVLDILNTAIAEETTIALTDGAIVVEAPRMRFKLPSMNPDEYPAVTIDHPTKYHLIKREALLTALVRTVYAVGESARHTLDCAAVQCDEQVTFYATDGKRMSRQIIDGESVDGHHSDYKSTLLPSQRANQLRQMLSKATNEDVWLQCGANDITVVCGAARMKFRKLEGRYPDAERLFTTAANRSEASTISVPVGMLASSIRQVAITTDHESRGIDWELERDQMVMQTNVNEIGQSRVEQPIQLTGDHQQARIDHKFVTDVCKTLDLEQILTVEMGANSPLRMFTDDGFTGILMPMAKES